MTTRPAATHPQAYDIGEPTAAHAAQGVGRATRQRLLVVDDERLDREIVARLAIRAGFAATAAPGVAEAVALLAEGCQFDIVVLDLSLRDGDSLSFLPTLARLNPQAAVAFASGCDDRVLRACSRFAAQLGLPVAGVLRKPVGPAALATLLGQAPTFLRHAPPPSISAEDLRSALKDGRIVPWFQPQVSLSRRTLTGAEALVRGFDRDGRQIMPPALITTAEQSGLIAELTDSVLDASVRASARWRRVAPALTVAVNLSPSLLDDAGLTDRIERALARHNVPPTSLVIEITEDPGVPQTVCAAEALTRLRIMGVQLSIDDFGTGHSGLLSLVRVPFTELKIDQAFVRDMLTDADASKVVRASASLARELGLTVVAEGVATADVAHAAREAGCDLGQGWLYGRPISEDEFTARMLTHGNVRIPPDAPSVADGLPSITLT